MRVQSFAGKWKPRRWALATGTDRVDCINMSSNLEHMLDHMVLIVDGGPVHRRPVVILHRIRQRTGVSLLASRLWLKWTRSIRNLQKQTFKA